MTDMQADTTKHSGRVRVPTQFDHSQNQNPEIKKTNCCEMTETRIAPGAGSIKHLFMEKLRCGFLQIAETSVFIIAGNLSRIPLTYKMKTLGVLTLRKYCPT